MTKKASPKTPPQADEPKPEPRRTAEEQALVEAWQTQPRLQRPPRLKEGEVAGAVVPDTTDLPLWAARMVQALGVDDPWLIDTLLSQMANCMPGAPASPSRSCSRSGRATVSRPCWRCRWRRPMP